MSSERVAYLGPAGTFTEQALLTEPDLGALERVPLPTIRDVLEATHDGEVDLGFAAIENSIEGAVNATLDALAFELDLLIQREVVHPVEMCLLAHEDVALGQIERVVSFPTRPPSATVSSPTRSDRSGSSLQTRPPMRRASSPAQPIGTRP